MGTIHLYELPHNAFSAPNSKKCDRLIAKIFMALASAGPTCCKYTEMPDITANLQIVMLDEMNGGYELCISK